MTRRVAACRSLRAAALIAILAISTMLAPDARADCSATIIETQDRVAFDGCIDQQSAEVVIRALDRRPLASLLVRSNGGAVNAAVEVAEVLARHRTRMVIRGQCLSSCANYWLPAAGSVDVEDGSAIGFHGDARTTFRYASAVQPLGPEAWRGLEAVLQQEAHLGSVVRKVAEVHALQSIRMSHEPLRVQLKGKWMICPGLTLSPVWAPTLERLQALGLVHRIVPRDGTFAPSITSDHVVHPMSAADDDTDPTARCVAAAAP